MMIPKPSLSGLPDGVKGLSVALMWTAFIEGDRTTDRGGERSGSAVTRLDQWVRNFTRVG